MRTDRLKQLRDSWTHRRGMRTVHALIDALEAADKMRPLMDSVMDGACDEAKSAGELYDAAKARI